MKNTYYLIASGEGSVTIKKFKTHEDAYNQMKSEYENFEFDNSEFGDGTAWIESDRAFTDSPVDGWQRHWCIVSVEELTEKKAETM